MDTGIKELQADHGLRVDGWMKPGGQTEGTLKTRLASADRLRYPDIRLKPGRSWERRGWGGPRGSLSVPTLRDEPERIEAIVKSTGYYRNKTKLIQGASRALVERHGGEVPRTMEELTALPGVGRKTANLVMGSAFGKAERAAGRPLHSRIG